MPAELIRSMIEFYLTFGVSAIGSDWKPTAPASAAVSSPATWKSRIPDVWIRNVRIGPVIVSPVRI